MTKLATAVGKINKSAVRVWLEKQDAFTLFRTVRKRFARNPYTVNNVMDVLECDLLNVQTLAKYIDMYRYVLSAIDVFSKFLHLVPEKTKCGPAIAWAFRPIFQDDDTQLRIVFVRTYKEKEFLNKQ